MRKQEQPYFIVQQERSNRLRGISALIFIRGGSINYQTRLSGNESLSGAFLKEKFAPMAQQMPPEVLEAITTLMSAKESFLDESLAAIKKNLARWISI